MYDFTKHNDYELIYLTKWHSEEALEILLFKYEIFIISKLKKFKVPYDSFSDYLQECKTEVCLAIQKYDERYGKTLCRFLEIIIERKIIRLLKKDSIYLTSQVNVDTFERFKSKENIVETAIYEQVLNRVKDEKLSSIKQNVLKEVVIEGYSIKEYSEKHNLTRKEVYNHLYGLRVRLRNKL